MNPSIAVAIIHGIGNHPADYAASFIKALRKTTDEVIGDHLMIESVCWSPVVEEVENRLWQRTHTSGELRYEMLRHFIIEFAGDMIVYEPTLRSRMIYDHVHLQIAKTLRQLAERAGGDAPLFLIAHSLGSVIFNNYFNDLRYPDGLSDTLRAQIGDTPLERGETLTAFYTVGSPLALWTMRFENFGDALPVPAPELALRYPALAAVGEWLNIYDPDDVVAFPLKGLNASYGRSVTRDVPIEIAPHLGGFTPMSHLTYWEDATFIRLMAERLTDLWKVYCGGASDADADADGGR